MSDRFARDVARLAAALLIALVGMGAATFYWGAVRGEELAGRADNLRRIEADRRILRGRILDRSGRVLAETTFEEGDPRRRYPYPSAAPVTGFQTWRYGAGGTEGRAYGSGGAERRYDAALRGDLGRSPRELLANRLLGRPQVGHDIRLTLDAELQDAAARALGERAGAVVVLDVADGAIRALVSQPSFDPERLDEAGGAEGADFVARSHQGLYPPGSTLKAVTLAAAYEEGLARPDEIVEDGDATGTFDGFAVACNNNPEGVTRFSLEEAFAYSCNLTFARLGEALGAARFTQALEDFGLAEAPPLPFPAAEASTGAADGMALPELVSAAFGQGEVLATPLHMALVAAALAGDGALPAPYLLEDVPGVRWGSLADERGTWRRAVSGGTAALLRRAMVRGVEDGWARGAASAGGPGFTAGGKTGTAETGGPEAPHSWFIGFAPAEDPRVAIAVIVENGGRGGDVAAPLAGRVLRRALELDESAE